MADADTLLQVFLIGGFSVIGAITLVLCLKKKAKTYHMKKSVSMEELNSTQIQDEGQYASPRVLEPTV